MDKTGAEPVTHVMDLSYDAAGQPLTLTLDGTVYFYLLNATGDILGLLDEDGNRVIHYACEGYGKSVYFNTSPTAATLGKLDPLAYRGYVMDYGTGLYYLQSRSYNYTTGRFINADAFVSTGQGILGNNMFAYCLNNPMSLVDPTGHCSYLGSINSPKQDCGRISCRESAKFDSHWQEIAALIGGPYSTYKGVLIIRTPLMENSSFSFGCILLADNISPTDSGVQLVRHEYGHTQQLENLGFLDYTMFVAIPSIISYWANEAGQLETLYYSLPWEYEADMYGGVTGRKYAPGTEQGYYLYKSMIAYLLTGEIPMEYACRLNS